MKNTISTNNMNKTTLLKKQISANQPVVEAKYGNKKVVAEKYETAA